MYFLLLEFLFDSFFKSTGWTERFLIHADTLHLVFSFHKHIKHHLLSVLSKVLAGLFLLASCFCLFLFMMPYFFLFMVIFLSYAAHCTWKIIHRDNLRSRINVPSSREDIYIHLPGTWGPLNQIQVWGACTTKHWIMATIQYMRPRLLLVHLFPEGTGVWGSLLLWRGPPIRLLFWFRPPLLHQQRPSKQKFRLLESTNALSSKVISMLCLSVWIPVFPSIMSYYIINY